MDPQIKDFIHAEMVAFGIAFTAERRAYLQKRINASGGLKDSLGFDADKQARQDAVTLLLAFEEHGRLIDMKRLKAVIPSNSDNEYVNAIENWIKTRGWEQKFIDAFVRRHNLRKPPPSVLNRIAWGIVIKRATRVRPRKWWNKSKTIGTADLFNKVVAGLPQETSNILTGAFK